MSLSKAVLPLVAIILLGTAGYYLIEGWALIDALYMTVISLTTVGYSETHPLSTSGKIFTMVLILSGIGSVAYIIGNVSMQYIHPFFDFVTKEKKMEKILKSIKDHYIICGYGRIGRDVCLNLIKAGKSVVVVDRQILDRDDFDKYHIPLVVGDASHEEILSKAGIERAKGLVSAVTSEAENVFITMTARELQPNLFIISRFEETATQKKLIRAGANKVINPYQIGSDKISHIILKPTISKILDFAQKRGQFELNIEELALGKNNPLIDKSLRNCGIREKHNIIIIAVEKIDGEIIANPGPDYVLKENDRLVMIANSTELKSVFQSYAKD
ncbi:potassium channel protein [bacterium]|nr:potassium channel protein [bacterium]